jgi:hypothetical protein
MCDLSDPEDVIMLSAKPWLEFLHKVRSDRLQPRRDGDYVYVEVQDPEVSERLQVLCTTAKAYAEFQRAAADQRFDGLKPAGFGLPHGPWIWAEGTVEEAKDRALDGVT